MIQWDIAIKLLAPLLVSSMEGDPNTNESLDYIPGQVIRGALVNQYSGPQDATHQAFRQLFLDGTVRFFNAYLQSEDGRRTLPTPKNWVVEKDRKEKDILNLLEQSPPQTKSLGAPYFSYDDSAVKLHQPDFELAVHNARNRQKGRALPSDEDSALFRYRALAKGQVFRAIIAIDNGLSQADVSKLEELVEGEYFLGTSSTAGYGRCRLTKVGAIDVREDQSNRPNNFGTGLVYLTSDLIARDPQTGQTGPYLVESLAAHFPDRDIQLAPVSPEMPAAFSRQTMVGGFNTTWGLPLSQERAALKGSVWRIKVDPPLNHSQIETVESTGIGERRAEGFGCIIFAPNWPTNPSLADSTEAQNKSPQQQQAQSFPSSLTSEEQELLNQMEKRLVEKELEGFILAKASQIVKSADQRRMISNSQIGRLRLKIRQVLFDEHLDFRPFDSYLESTSKRRVANDQFRRFQIGNLNFREWLIGLTRQFVKVTDEEKASKKRFAPDIEARPIWDEIELEKSAYWDSDNMGLKRYLLRPEPYRLDGKKARQATAKLITSVCEQLARMDGGSR